MLNDQVNITGRIKVELLDKSGEIILEKEFPNIVTTVGKNHIADRLSDTPTESAISHYAIGSGSNDPDVGDTTLQTELARVTIDYAQDSSNVVSYRATFPAGVGTGAITEYGMLNASSGGTLLARATASAINKTSDLTLIVTHNLTIS